MAQQHQLPHDYDAEAAVIGSLLLLNVFNKQLTPGAYDVPALVAQVRAILTPDDFYDPVYRRIYAGAILVDPEKLDTVSVAHAMASRNLLREGDRDIIAEAIMLTPVCCHILYYAQIVRAHADARRQIQRGADMVRRGFQAPPIIPKIQARGAQL